MTGTEAIVFLEKSFQVIRKKRRKSLSIKISSDQFKVFTNESVPKSALLDFLQSKQAWLSENIKIIEDKKLKFPQPKFEDGSLFPFYGELKHFNFIETKLKKILFQVEDGFLICSIPRQDPSLRMNINELKKALIKFYKASARDFLIPRCFAKGQELALIPNNVKIQTARARWGSCSSKKVIQLNWKLMVFPRAIMDYVIVHELCHLKHLNHSADFWNLVESNFPNYKEIESEIKSQYLRAEFLK